jgi:ferric-dicitrate binding protein FerR (iron transport regulator)
MKKDYTRFNADDFLQDSYFLAWMRNEHPEINAFWAQWQKEHPEKWQVIAEAREQYRALISFEPVRPGQEEQEEVWQHIESQIQEYTEQHNRKIFRIRFVRWSAAAAVVLLFVSGWFMYKQKLRSSEGSFVVIQAGADKKQIVLADSSVVVLNAYTTLKYHPGNYRELWMKGEAFFDVKHHETVKNKAKPFTVHAGMEDIVVLGTAFTVKTIQQAARVVLLRGKVKTSVNDHAFLMKPGDKVEWDKDNGNFSAEEVNPQLYMAWKDGEFHFDHTTLKEIKELVKDVYGYDLVIKNKSSLKTTSITGTVSAMNEGVLWKTLSIMFDAKVEKVGHQVIIIAH